MHLSPRQRKDLDFQKIPMASFLGRVGIGYWKWRASLLEGPCPRTVRKTGRAMFEYSNAPGDKTLPLPHGC